MEWLENQQGWKLQVLLENRMPCKTTKDNNKALISLFWGEKMLRKPRRKQCEGCKLFFMDNELKLIHAKVRVGKKRIIRPHLALCCKCREIEILEGI